MNEEKFLAEEMRDLFTRTQTAVEALEEKVNDLISGASSANVQLTGSKMELYGKTISDRPAANTVPVGATFTIVDDKLDQNWISDGTNWEEV